MVGIDTVVLTLQPHEFVIMQPQTFTPHASKVLSAVPKDMGRNKYFQAVRNPTKGENKELGYLPYVTLYRALRSGGLVTELRIQFSVSKLLLGNNFDEPDESQFSEACQKLLDALKHYNIRLWEGIDTLRNAKVATVHYSKNFPLTNRMSTRQAVTEIQRCDVNSWRDVSESSYLNNGHGFKTHSKYYELAFYDKIAEYKKGKRGQPTFDMDNQVQLDMFEDNTKVGIEVLRMEVRLGNAKRIKSELSKAGVTVDELTFVHLYDKQVSQAVLLYNLRELWTRYPKIVDAEANSVPELLAELRIQNPRSNMSTIIAAIGLRELAKDSGVRVMKDIVGQNGAASLLRLVKKTNTELKYRKGKAEVFELLEEQLNRFEPVSIKDFIK